MPSLEIDRVLEASLYVDDLEEAQDFYSRVLGLEIFSAANGRDLMFRCGQGMLLLFDPSVTNSPESGVPPHGATGPGHVAFAVNEADLDAWRDRLRGFGVQIEKEINWPIRGKSVYFRDPSGNSLELATPQVWGLEA